MTIIQTKPKYVPTCQINNHIFGSYLCLDPCTTCAVVSSCVIFGDIRSKASDIDSHSIIGLWFFRLIIL